jgi:hypothetical protein
MDDTQRKEALRLADYLTKGAEVNGTQHMQADWQRIAQRQAAALLRELAAANQASALPLPADGAEYVLELLVAAGHVSRETVDKARDIARDVGKLPAAPLLAGPK